MKRLALAWMCASVFLIQNTQAQNHYIEWEAGLEIDGTPKIQDLKKTHDDGFLIVGHAGNYPYDAFVLKVDDSGTEEWSHVLGGSDQDIFMESVATPDLGYIVVGHSESDDGDVPGNYGTQDDIWVVKFDKDGVIVWNKNLGGTSTDEGLGIVQLTSGDYVITGRTFSRDIDFDGELIGGGNGSYFAMKIDDDGYVLDFNTYGNTGIQRQGYAAANPDGGLFISGITTSAGGDVSNYNSGVFANTDTWVVVADQDLSLLSENTYGGTDFDQPIGIITTADGGYLTYGYTKSTDVDLASSFGGYDIMLVKADDSGSKEWVKNLGTASDEQAYSVQQTIDGGYIIAGSISSPSGGYGNADHFLTKITDTGVIEFDYLLGTSSIDYQPAAVEISDEHFVLAGSSLHASPSGVKTVTGDLWVVAMSPCTDDVRAPDFTTCLVSHTVSAGTTLIDYTTMVTVTDGCDAAPTLTQSPAIGSATTDGMTVTVTATDASGNANSCTFIVNLTPDVTDPVITCPSDQSVSCDNLLPDYTSLASATDDVDPTPDITQSPTAGSTVTDGMVITLTATDDAGNTDNCTFTVSISADTEKPTIVGLTDQFVDCNEILPDYTGLGTAADNCDASPIVTQSPTAGSAVTNGMTVTLTATDDAGNSDDFTFDVYVNADTEVPVISGLVDQSVNCGTTLQDYTGLGTLADNCDAAPVVTQSPAIGTAVTDGMTVTLTATDVSGNSQDYSFTVLFNPDLVGPGIVGLVDQTLDCGEALPDYTMLGIVTDNCDDDPTVTQAPAAGSLVTDGITVTLTAEDAAGNSNNFSFLVTINADTEVPVISGLSDQSVSCGSTLQDYTSLGTLSDNCDTAPDVSQSPVPGTAVTDGMTVTLTATDAAGNSKDYNFDVYLDADIEAPTIVGLTDQNVECGSALLDYTSLGTVFDNCDASPTVSQSPDAGTPVTDGMVVTLTAKDEAGNEADFGLVIHTNEDVEAPVISDISDQLVDCKEALPDYTSLFSVSDNCDADPSLTQNPTAGADVIDGMSVTMVATDEAGNTSETSFQVFHKEDQTAPTLSCPADITLTCGDQMPDLKDEVDASDNCASEVTISQLPEAGTILTDDTTVEITATDENGNSSSCSAQITVQDITIDAGEDITIIEGASTGLAAHSEHEGQVNWSPNHGLLNAQTLSPTASPDFTTSYTVLLENSNGCVAEDEVTVFVNEPEFNVGISPNGDGINDHWIIKDIDQYPDNTVYIYNRWGNLIYEQYGYDNQTKVFEGKANRLTNITYGELPAGTYFFHIQVSGKHQLEKTEGYLIIKK